MLHLLLLLFSSTVLTVLTRHHSFPSHSSYGLSSSSSSSYGGYNVYSSYGEHRSWKEEEGNIARDDKEESHVVIGHADNSDPCFARYANVIIMNAQPYERRSRISLLDCKEYCLIFSQDTKFSCASLVYDNVNQVCDLFSHTGDEKPARLLKFQTRDYFEPSFDDLCDKKGKGSVEKGKGKEDERKREKNKSRGKEQEKGRLSGEDWIRGKEEELIKEVTRTTESPTVTTTAAIARASNTVERTSPDLNPPSLPEPPPIIPVPASTSFSSSSSSSSIPSQPLCQSGKSPIFLRTAGFELYKADDETLEGVSEDECKSECEKRKSPSFPFDCRSFDFSHSSCFLSSQSAVPLGNGQLKQNPESAYYESVCVDATVARQCTSFSSRFPQMILVGFAESVTDALSFEQCFERCVNSFQIYGFNCTSGMYYFEEDELNCILNTENRQTQALLFSEETTDIVDYFEHSCYPTLKPEGASKVEGIRSQNLVIAPRTNTEWSECKRGVQHRRIDCDKGLREKCGLQSRLCSMRKKKAK